MPNTTNTILDTSILTPVKDLPLKFVDISLEASFKKSHLQKLMALFFGYVTFIFGAFVLWIFLMCLETRRNLTSVPINVLISDLYQNTLLLMTASLLSLVVFTAILLKIISVQNKSVQVIGGLLSKVDNKKFSHYMYFVFDQPGIDQAYCKLPVSKQLASNPLIGERYHLVLFGDGTVDVFPIEEIVPPSERKGKSMIAKMRSNKYY